MRDFAEVERSMTNQAPINDEVVGIFEEIRVPFKEAARKVCESVPEGRDKSLALTHLEDALMRAIRGVALDQPAALHRRTSVWSNG